MSTTPVVNVTTTKVEDGKFTFNISITMDVSSTAIQSTAEPHEFVSTDPESVRVEVEELDGVTKRTVSVYTGGYVVRRRVTAVAHAAEEDDDDSVSSYEDETDDEEDEDTTEADTERLREDLKYWVIVNDNPVLFGWLIAWPADIRSVYRGRHGESDPVIHTGTLYHMPLRFEESELGDGYWVKKDSELARLILQNQPQKELTAREKLEADMKEHWFVDRINPNADDEHTALIRVTDKSANACRWHVMDTHGVYHRDLYYVKECDGYWVNKDSDLVKMIRESGNACREDPIAKAEEEAEEEAETAKRLDAETEALRADLRYWEIHRDKEYTHPDEFVSFTERSLLIDIRDTRSLWWNAANLSPAKEVPTGHLYHRPTIVRHDTDKGFWITRDSPLGRLMLERNSVYTLNVPLSEDETKPSEDVPNIQDDWKNWKIACWENKEYAIIKPTEKSVFSHCPVVFNGKMGVPVVWARTGPPPLHKSRLTYNRDCEGYRIHHSSVLLLFLPRYTYEEYYYSQYGRYPTDSIPSVADEAKHWEFVAWKDGGSIIIRPGSKSKYHNCPDIVSLTRHTSNGGSVGYILRYDTINKGYRVNSDDENFASIRRPTYGEFINKQEATEAQNDFAKDIANHWSVVVVRNKTNEASGLIRPKGGSEYAHRPKEIDTHGLYHRPIYYSPKHDGYWVGKDSGLFATIRENGGYTY
jgi:hypothetical protein